MLYTYYGDDFTGSTDVLEQLALGGVRAVLFLRPPSADDLAQFPGLQAVGVAGDSRSQTPEWMSANLPTIFEQLRNLGAPVTHYKVCSTFDSSPQRGSIGRAIELGLATFHSHYVPIVVGAPHLRRFVWQGNLFASDPTGAIHRIDRHPMSRHPVTPMREPNLRQHLAAQTDLPINEIAETTSAAKLQTAITSATEAGAKALVFDTVAPTDLQNIGNVLWDEAAHEPMFAVGSSGLTSALIHAWRASGVIQENDPLSRTSAATNDHHPLLVISGSCSAATERQLRWALANGFHGIPIDPAALLEGHQTDELRQQIIEATIHSLQQGKDTILYTSLGTPEGASRGDDLGAALGSLLKEILSKTQLHRVLLCGGDTSSHAIQQLNLRALTWLATLQTGAPLCQAHAEGAGNGLQLILKGGQVGTDDFFAVAREAQVSR